MKNVHQLKGDSDTSTFFSFKNPQYLHILVELLLLLIIMLYVRRNVGRLQRQINDLKAIVQKQQETLNLHEQILRGNQPSIVTKVPWPTPQTSVSPPQTSFQAPPLPSFETIATIFNVPLDGSTTNGNGQDEPIDPSNTTIIDTTTTGRNDDHAVSKTFDSLQQIEQELAEEINELNIEQEKHTLTHETTTSNEETQVTPHEVVAAPSSDSSSDAPTHESHESHESEDSSDSDEV